jgi:hypothetical protein
MGVSSSMDSRITDGKDLEREYKGDEQGCQRGLDTAVHEGSSAAVMIWGVGEKTCWSRNEFETLRVPSVNGRDRHSCKRIRHERTPTG